jgi:polyphosphate kinase 2 (PPK2 family)
MQDRLRELEYTIYRHRLPVIIVYEGRDAAGKGGNIRRLTQKLDPRGYEVVPITAPNDVQKQHHYFWRFWLKLPKAGHITIFDRSWYGRILVERVEGLAREAEWRRAYDEINDAEKHWTRFGALLLKFWLEIDSQEQLRRFRERERMPHKRWKITAEDWRNRRKADLYRQAAEEMLARTDRPDAPWHVIASNCKLYARIQVMQTVIRAVEERL